MHKTSLAVCCMLKPEKREAKRLKCQRYFVFGRSRKPQGNEYILLNDKTRPCLDILNFNLAEQTDMKCIADCLQISKYLLTS